MTREVLVVGVGNDDRGDDAIGLEVARQVAAVLDRSLPPADRARVRVLAHGGDPLGLIDVWSGVPRLVLIDAIVSGAEAGTIHRLDPELPFATAGDASTHAFGLATAVALARAIGRLPPHVELWGVEGVRFTVGEGVSEAVGAAGGRLARRLADGLLRDLVHAPAARARADGTGVRG